MTQPYSLVGMVAVDKSVYLMNASNDITMENVSVAVSPSKNTRERETIAGLQISERNFISSSLGVVNSQESFQIN